jgi:murein DD-endopeptidase MepM/ murein hydrolase activator NlpD
MIKRQMIMKKKSCKYTPRSWINLGILSLFLAACSTQYPESCPSGTLIGLLDADEIASDNSLPFRFPLDESTVDYDLFFGWFGVSNECPPDMPDCYNYSNLAFHAAEDYKRPAGTPVYAIADGHISYSGPAGGYGWLILIDHPQANLYSLYGHLSPSRWKLKSGTDVKRGDLIAYLGDPDENGGSAENPLEPHLHFGIRTGQKADFPGRGEWRFMAGWIRLCPQDLGWLQPSQIITSQEIPPGWISKAKSRFPDPLGFGNTCYQRLRVRRCRYVHHGNQKAIKFRNAVPRSDSYHSQCHPAQPAHDQHLHPAWNWNCRDGVWHLRIHSTSKATRTRLSHVVPQAARSRTT